MNCMIYIREMTPGVIEIGIAYGWSLHGCMHHQPLLTLDDTGAETFQQMLNEFMAKRQKMAEQDTAELIGDITKFLQEHQR